MENEMQKVSFAVACKQYFGMKPNQTLGEFSQELKQLTDKDKEDFKRWFPSVGYEIV
jgi:hypothetical protein